MNNFNLNKNIIFKILAIFVIINLIFVITDIKFIVKPCDNKESCRSQKICYKSDCNRKYIYHKKYMNKNEISQKLNNNSRIEDPYKLCCKQCSNFIYILIILIFSFTFCNLIYSSRKDKLFESFFIFISLLLLFVFFPNITLHAANSNIFTHYMFTEKNGKIYKFEPEIISNN